MKTGILLASIVLLAACAAATEKEIEAREYRDAERLAQFLEIRRNCLESGGILIVQGLEGRVGRSSIPKSSDQVRCHRSLSFR